MTHGILSSHCKHFLIPLPLIAFFAVFLCGILFANLKWSDEVFWLGFQTENSLRQFEASALSVSAFALFFLKYRLLWWLFPALAVILCKRSQFPLAAFFAWLGFALGFFVTTMIRRFGIASFPLLFSMLFPQTIFYVLAYSLLLKTARQNIGHNKMARASGRLVSNTSLRHTYSQSKSSKMEAPSERYANIGKNPSHDRFLYLCPSLGIYLAGIFCEYALNPWLLEKIQIFLQ